MDKIKIPVAIGIIVDDVGWHNGEDQRMQGLPARSGLPRIHHPDDVRALNAIGKGLNTKIICSLVLGDWDRNNTLRGIPHITPDESSWDAAGEMDPEYTKAYFNALEESEYLDYSLHGLFHSYYENGKLNTARQYYPNTYNEQGEIDGYRWLPTEEFRRMIDLFYGIYNDWGFKKKIDVFVSPCGCWGTPDSEGNKRYAEVLREYGIKYWCNSWREYEETLGTVNGIMASKGDDICPWNAYDVDPRYLENHFDDPDSALAYICGHLTNFIRYNPEKNFEYVDAWIAYFKKHTDHFGTMMARDIPFAASQYFYSKLSRIEKQGTTYIIDLSQLSKIDAKGLSDKLYLSFKKETEPTECLGGSLRLYEEKADHNIYEITRNGDPVLKIQVK